MGFKKTVSNFTWLLIYKTFLTSKQRKHFKKHGIACFVSEEAYNNFIKNGLLIGRSIGQFVIPANKARQILQMYQNGRINKKQIIESLGVNWSTEQQIYLFIFDKDNHPKLFKQFIKQSFLPTCKTDGANENFRFGTRTYNNNTGKYGYRELVFPQTKKEYWLFIELKCSK